MDAIYWASAEVLVAATRLGADRDMPAPETLRQELLRLLQQMVTRCRKAGVSDKQIAEARYAVVAFIDDRILRSNWNGRVAWMNQPLQLQLYNEFAAGENFFVRMRALIEAGESQALEIYYLCLALGFVGAAGAAGRSQPTIDRARGRLARLAPGAALSPHAVPTDHYSATTPRRPLVLGLVLACLAIVGLGLGLLRWSLNTRIEQDERDLAAAAARTAEARERP